MKKQILKTCLVLATIVGASNSASAAPTINAVGGVIQNGQNIIVSGDGFGQKSNPAPVYWNNLENETIGGGLLGWSVSAKPGPVITNSQKWSGEKSLYFAYKNNNWNQILRDLGASPKWFFHYKLKMDKNDTNSRFQWKAWRISSSPDGYAWNTEDSTTVMMNDWWWRTTGWYNTSTFTFYNNAGTSTYTQGSLNATDAVLLGQWQTLEEYSQMSSAPMVADGITNVWRDGRLILGKTNHISHDAGSGQWRYMLLGQGINNELDANGVDVTGTCDIDIYYDDIYIDSTQARAEICDSSSWNSRKHCEMQIPTAWNANQISLSLNKGTFADGQAYLYVVDENGNVNSSGYPVNFGGSINNDTAAPSAPQGLIVQ